MSRERKKHIPSIEELSTMSIQTCYCDKGSHSLYGNPVPDLI